LWEGRFRAGLVESERYFLACMRYIELNPVRAGLCAQPEQWAWSSAAHHLGLTRSELLTEHELYWSLGNTPFEREHAYREFMAQGVPADEREQFTEGALRGRPVGKLKSAAALTPGQAQVAERRPRGRPRKPADSTTGAKR
jgi:putative transposase